MSSCWLLVHNNSCVSLVEPDGRCGPDLGDIDLVPDQSPDIVDSVPIAKFCVN